MDNKINCVKLQFTDDCLAAVTPDGISRTFAFPAVAVSFGGKRIEAATAVTAPHSLADGSLQAEYADGSCRFKVTVTPGRDGYFFKQLELSADSDLPTPDYVEVDFQKQQLGFLECRGYMCTSKEAGESLNDEQGSGVVPGCGYPLIGNDMFTGLEHPAAYNTIVSEEKGVYHWRLRHYPVWENRKITSYRAVIGLSEKPLELFKDYVDTFRLPGVKTPLVAFCTFWSDPYAGNQEYLVTRDNYDSFIDGFNKLDLHPEIYTLDAGWQDRNSILKAKESYGGEKVLMEIGEKVRKSGAGFSLWVSPNGPVGITANYLRSRNIAVGTGASCHYCYGEYGVLLDKKLEKELTDRACELVEKYGVCHFKVDWDNECATSVEFEEKYPTRNHVREATINVMARINKAARQINPMLKTRNGRWPSPWYLALTTHTSLPNGGDCEFGDLPALSQRDAASNHRDYLYWCVFCRDKSVFPLDVLDNHEFGHSIRMPFQESPGVWSNACVWAVMRGSSYHQYTLLPESLEDWQADTLKSTIAMLRKDYKKILTGRSYMTGGNPIAGNVYGFVHPSENGSCILALRNSSPMPMEYILPTVSPFYEQTYPDCRKYRAGDKVFFAPHEVKVLNGTQNERNSLPTYPCQLVPNTNGTYQYYLPASERPDVLKVHQVPELEKFYTLEEKTEKGFEITFGVKVPWRMREFKVLFKINTLDCSSSEIHLRTSRLKDCHESSYSLLLTEIPNGLRGSGEHKNPDSVPERNCRYFAADLPQGGDLYFSLTIDKENLTAQDIELWVTGYEAPARKAEDEEITVPSDIILPPPYPSGFPRNLRLL